VTGTIVPEGLAEDPTRRQVNVLFCDLVGSTALAGELDPEEYQEVLDRYRECVSGVIAAHAGHLHHTLGDGLMASWGHPRAREDDAVRSVMAGLAVVDAIGRLNAASSPSGPRIQVRVAIHTGIAVVADIELGGLHEQGNVVGETPNVAARLQSVGSPGTVVVSESTHDLVQERFEFADLGVRSLNGVSRQLRVFAVQEPKGLLQAGSSTELAMVGREQETGLLTAAWRRAMAGATETVEVVGEAGMGKSRLVQQLYSSAQADGHPPVVVRCSPLWTHTAFEAMRQFLLGAAGASPGDAVERVEPLLRGLFGRIGVSEPVAVAALLSLVGVPADGKVTPSPEERREHTFLALATLIESLTAGAAALVIFDDLQWADPSTTQLVRRLGGQGRRAGRLLVLVSRTGSEPAAEAQQIRLGPLHAPAVTELARLVVPGLSADWYETLVARSDGVPLFVTELGRGFARRGTGEAPPIPPRLNDLLVARLDQHPEQRKVLQVLAAIGPSAERSLLEAILDRSSQEIGNDLERLMEAGILLERGPRRNPSYRFSHVLLQEAAYTTMLKRRRRHIHRAVADQLLAPDQVEVVPANVIAHHLEHAGDVSASLTWWWRSALEASDLAAHPETIRHLRHVLDLLPAAGSSHQLDEAAVLVLLGGSLVAIEGYTSPEVSRVVERARKVLVSAPNSVTGSGTYYQLWAYHHVRGELPEAIHLSELLSRRRDDAAASVMRGHDLFEQGDLAGALEHLERGRRLAAVHRGQSLRGLTGGVPHDVTAATTVVLGVVQWMTGQRGTGRRTVQEAIAHAQALGPPTGAFTRAYVHCYASWFDLLDGDVERAAADARISIDEATAHGYQTWLVSSSIHAAGVAATLGDAESSVPTLQALLAVWRDAGAEAFRPAFLRWLARGYAAGGDPEASIAALDEAITHVQRFGDRLHLPELLRERGLMLCELGSVNAAAAGFQAAADESERQGAWSFAVRALVDLAQIRSTDPMPRAALRVALPHVQDPAPGPDLLRARALIAKG
jgi:class 3 adenylate cyclase/tetratricopeptide (TPR) repeat protein